MTQTIVEYYNNQWLFISLVVVSALIWMMLDDSISQNAKRRAIGWLATEINLAIRVGFWTVALYFGMRAGHGSYHTGFIASSWVLTLPTLATCYLQARFVLRAINPFWELVGYVAMPVGIAITMVINGLYESNLKYYNVQWLLSSALMVGALGHLLFSSQIPRNAKLRALGWMGTEVNGVIRVGFWSLAILAGTGLPGEYHPDWLAASWVLVFPTLAAVGLQIWFVLRFIPGYWMHAGIATVPLAIIATLA